MPTPHTPMTADREVAARSAQRWLRARGYHGSPQSWWPLEPKQIARIAGLTGEELEGHAEGHTMTATGTATASGRAALQRHDGLTVATPSPNGRAPAKHHRVVEVRWLKVGEEPPPPTPRINRASILAEQLEERRGRWADLGSVPRDLPRMLRKAGVECITRALPDRNRLHVYARAPLSR